MLYQQGTDGLPEWALPNQQEQEPSTAAIESEFVPGHKLPEGVLQIPVDVVVEKGVLSVETHLKIVQEVNCCQHFQQLFRHF